jgi:hypothetical protein
VIGIYVDESIREQGFAEGIEGYFPQQGLPREKLTAQIQDMLNQLDEVLGEIQTVDDPEAQDHIGFGKLYHLVEHLSYHLGQIVLIARLKTGEPFDFVRKGINEAQLNALIQKESGGD